MRNRCAWAGLVLVVLVVPGFGADEKKDDKKTDDKNAPTKEEYAALRQAGEALGRLVSVSATDKSLTLRLEYSVAEPKNPDGSADVRLQNLLAQQQQALLIGNPLQRQRRLQSLSQQLDRLQRDAVRVTKQHKDFDLVATDKVQVRLSEPPAKFDEKGNAIKYTAQELKELKGKGPGYQSDFDGLEAGQLVRVYFAKKAKKEDKDAKDKDAAADDKPPVRLIYVQVSAGVDKMDKGKDKGKKP